MTGCVLRNVRLKGRSVDVRVADGRIVEIDSRLARGKDEIDGEGGAVLPGLHDHHIHLLASAADARSVRVDPASCANWDAFVAKLVRHARENDNRPVRAVGYHDDVAGPMDRHILDRVVGDRPLRLQYWTGTLWVVNSAMLRQLAAQGLPPGAERDSDGRPNGRIWDADDWMKQAGGELPPLGDLSGTLSRHGITRVTDASHNTGSVEAAFIAGEHSAGRLAQHPRLMSGGLLDAAPDGEYELGEVKILLHENRLPSVDDALARVAAARASGRNVAFHCVTEGELAFLLAVMTEAGVVPGDRVEHGSIIPRWFIGPLAGSGLAVVTQPHFLAERGDRYVAEHSTDEHESLYRANSLIRANILLAGSSDAPYGTANPWLAMHAAVTRVTASGAVLGSTERLDWRQALALFRPRLTSPFRHLAVGDRADMVVVRGRVRDVIEQGIPEPVVVTLVAGRPVYLAGGRQRH